jgi:hypothetical protein
MLFPQDYTTCAVGDVLLLWFLAATPPKTRAKGIAISIPFS